MESAGVFEGVEGAVDLAGFLVAAEQVTDVSTADAVGTVPRERPDVVGSGIAKRVAEDPCSGVGAVAPDRERGLEVLEVDPIVGVQQRVDQREPGRMRFGAGGRRAEHPGTFSGQRGVGRDPPLSGAVGERHPSVLAIARERDLDAIAGPVEILPGQLSAERQQLRALHGDH